MSNKKYLVIDSRPYGFFSIFLHTIDNIKWCEDNNKIPIIRWNPGRRDSNIGRKVEPNFLNLNKYPAELSPCLYFEKDGFNGKDNVWEYYFEPISNLQTKDLTEEEYDISDIFLDGNKFLIENIRTYEPLLLWKILGTIHEKEHRKKVYDIINKYVKLNEQVSAKLDKFTADKFTNDGKYLAIHVRGTDKRLEYPHRMIPMDAYINEAKKYLYDKPDYKIMLASDNNEFIRYAMTKFDRERVIIYPSLRMEDYHGTTPVCLSASKGALVGEQVLIEACLLAKCEHLICTDSNVAAAVLFMNPEMTVSYLNRVKGA